MNRAGSVLSASLASSAGSEELDAAALALFRGGGLPPPPPDVPGATFSFTIPIRFNSR
jgi:protein TonB